jgi:hypothetical protein
MGDLAFLYRMMAVGEYKIPEVNAMEVWEVAVALHVDEKVTPWRDPDTGPPPEPRVVNDDLMNTPTGVDDFGIIGPDHPFYAVMMGEAMVAQVAVGAQDG